MTRFTVTWTREAQDQLALLWLNSLNRAAVTRAADEIDRTLAVDPLDKGYDVGEGLRGLVVPPLFVMFIVKEADRMVEVLRVRLD